MCGSFNPRTNERKLLYNGCYKRIDEGLSHFGLDAVREMNRLKIPIGLSHCGEQTTLEAIESSSQPVAITHANVRVFVDFARNKSDVTLRALAERGGVIKVVSFPIFLRHRYQSSLNDFGDVINDLVQRVCVDHVGIGNHLCQDQPHRFFQWLFARQGKGFRPLAVETPNPHRHPHDLEMPNQMPNLAGALLNRGYSEEDISRIIGGNCFRLFREGWTDGEN